MLLYPSAFAVTISEKGVFDAIVTVHLIHHTRQESKGKKRSRGVQSTSACKRWSAIGRGNHLENVVFSKFSLIKKYRFFVNKYYRASERPNNVTRSAWSPRNDMKRENRERATRRHKPKRRSLKSSSICHHALAYNPKDKQTLQPPLPQQLYCCCWEESRTIIIIILTQKEG